VVVRSGGGSLPWGRQWRTGAEQGEGAAACVCASEGVAPFL
jgi:hypothetical protein